MPRLILLVLASVVLAQDTGYEIAWSKDLPEAFAAAKDKQKILLICVNAKYVDGRKKEERANKGLREIIYKDERVIAKSREFVCVLFTPGATTEEFGELRMLGIGGNIVAPQHIFVHPDGSPILLREKYWSHGSGEAGVKAMVALMAKAQAEFAGAGEKEPDEQLSMKDAPADGDARAAWIRQRIKEVVEGSPKERDNAIAFLVKNDKDGDCTTPLLALLDEYRKDPDALVPLIRGMGRDKFFAAAAPIAQFLTHKDERVRGNAAVSLEYIGSRDKKVVAALLKAAGREKNANLANHLYRAVGRCGVEDSKVRATLLKKCGSGKNEFVTYGPAIGLAYFESDKKAARGVEKILKKIGIPGGRGGGPTIKRALVSWTLASIGDEKSGDFVRTQLIEKLKNVKSWWVNGLLVFYRAVARGCDGDKAALQDIENGVRGAVGIAKRFQSDRADDGSQNLMDEFRKGRDEAGFTPRGDYILQG